MSEGVKGRAWDSKRANFDRNLAVVIGIDHYSNDSIRNLSTAVSDASAIADLLEQKYDYKQSAEKPEVIRLFDKEATLEALRDLFNTKIPQELEPGEGDRLIIYFAGHGLPRSNEDGPEGYLVPHDADSTEPSSFLAMRDISEALNKLECHHLLVILDCCFAGTFRWAGSRKAVPILETIHREHYYHFICHPAWQVITSSAHNQEALDVARLKEDNRQPVAKKSGFPFANKLHSPFALALLEGLHPGDGTQRVKADLFPDGVVTAHELFVYLQTRVKQLSGEQQAPGIYPLRREYDRGEFVFVRPDFNPLDPDPTKGLKYTPLLDEKNNPYRGLKSFDEKHADFFFGRQLLIEELAKRLAQPDQVLTVVLGVSGSGKSSLVKAGLIPHLRNQHLVQICFLELLLQFPPSPLKLRLMSQIYQWRILEPMRPGESPFVSLARTLLPITDESLLKQLAEVSFLDILFQPMLKSKAEPNKISVNETIIKVADSWCSAKPEAKLLLIEDYYTELEKIGNPQQREQLKNLYNQILEKLDSVSQRLQDETLYFKQVIDNWQQNHPGTRLLLVIDQFEELLTRSQDDRESSNRPEQEDGSTAQKEWQKFLAVVRNAIEKHSQTLRLVLTLRSDFEPRFLSSALKSYWKDARFPVRAMTSDELRQAIESPALKQAIYFEELKDDRGNTTGNLVSKLVDEVGQMPGALPLLSFTLSELYVNLYKRWQEDQSTDRTLQFADYEALGGVAGALTRRATEEYEALDEKHQATMRRVMLRMVAIEGGGVTRRRVPESELVYTSEKENGRVSLVIARLVGARLFIKGWETGEPFVEPAHDFLVRGWDKLQKWIKEKQEDISLQHRLTPAANDWKNKRGMLWIEEVDRLSRLEKVYESADNWLNQLETEFFTLSLRERQDRIKKLEEDLRTSEKRRTRAELREKATRSLNILPFQDSLSLVLIVQSVGQNLEELPEEILIPVQASLSEVMKQTTVQHIFSTAEKAISSVSFSPDGKTIISGSKDGKLCFWDLSGNPVSKSFQGHEQEITSVTFSPNGKIIASGSKDGSLRLWNTSGEPIGHPFRGHQSAVSSVVFFNEIFILSGSWDGTARLWAA